MKLISQMLTVLVMTSYAVNAFMIPISSTQVPRGSRHHDAGVTSSLGSASSTLNVPPKQKSGSLRMGLGDVFSKAFANEEMGGKDKNPGLKSNIKWCMVTVNGKTVKAVQGQRLRDAVQAAGAKIEYGCEKGDCGTCESLVDGRKVRVCKAIVPRNKDTLTVKTKFG